MGQRYYSSACKMKGSCFTEVTQCLSYMSGRATALWWLWTLLVSVCIPPVTGVSYTSRPFSLHRRTLTHSVTLISYYHIQIDLSSRVACQSLSVDFTDVSGRSERQVLCTRDSRSRTLRLFHEPHITRVRLNIARLNFQSRHLCHTGRPKLKWMMLVFFLFNLRIVHNRSFEWKNMQFLCFHILPSRA